MVLMRLADVLYGVPLLFVVMVFFMAARSWMLSLPNVGMEASGLIQAGLLFIALGLIQWPSVARLARGRTVELRSSGFVLAAEAMGLGRIAIMRRHLFPHLLAPLVAYGVLLVPGLMVEEAFLSFLGFGIQPPNPSVGNLLRDGLVQADRAPLLALAPLLILIFTTLGLHLLARRMEAGDG